MFLNSSAEMWKHLEKGMKLLMVQESTSCLMHRMRLSKVKSVTGYYIEMRGLCEELELLNNLPPITTLTSEVNAFVKAMNDQQL